MVVIAMVVIMRNTIIKIIIILIVIVVVLVVVVVSLAVHTCPHPRTNSPAVWRWTTSGPPSRAPLSVPA